MRRLVLFIWYLTGAGILKRYRAARRERDESFERSPRKHAADVLGGVLLSALAFFVLILFFVVFFILFPTANLPREETRAIMMGWWAWFLPYLKSGAATHLGFLAWALSPFARRKVEEAWEEARIHEEVADHELRGAQTLVDKEDET